jgi:DNA helicase HerA-like ATPase
MPNQSAPALATSVDGRLFIYNVPVDQLGLHVGGYVVIDAGRSDPSLGYVTNVALPEHDRTIARVEGRMLEEPGEAFSEGATRIARPEEIARWLDSVRSPRARLNVGGLRFADTVPLELDAGAFDRHTFLCGQSGSGKTYAVGTILERLLVETSLRMVVIDPNSDFVRLGEPRDDASDEVRARYAAVGEAVAVRRAGDAGHGRLHVRFRDFDSGERAAVLRLDPIDDRDEYAALADAFEPSDSTEGVEAPLAGTVQEAIAQLWESAEPFHSLGVRARNLEVDRWEIWSGTDPGSLEDLVQPGGPRCVVADVGSLDTRDEQAVAVEALLAALWRRRGAREPMLIVIDEAQNVCPAIPQDRLTALATEHAVRIAGEGRKFGLVLFAVTQRPQKVNGNVVSQCDNLVLMRMNSRSDLALLSETFSFVPPSLFALASEFHQGEALVAGKLVPSPTLGHFGPRWSAEGGADIPADWATIRR